MKRMIAILLMVCMTLSMTAIAADYEGHWSEAAITEARNRGWMMGDGAGNFRPDDSITRAEFAVMLWRALEKPEPKGVCQFSDVTQDAFYYDAATALYEKGIIAGYDGGLFGPNDMLTREMGCTMLARTLELAAKDPDAYKNFEDGVMVSSWAADAISAMTELGYISGVGENLFAPKIALTRGAMAKLLITIFEEEKEVDVPKPDEQKPEVEKPTPEEPDPAPKATNVGMFSKLTEGKYDGTAVFNVKYYNKDEISVQSSFTMDQGGQFNVLQEGDVVVPAFDYDGLVKKYAYIATLSGSNLVYGAGVDAAKPIDGKIKYTIGELIGYDKGYCELIDSKGKSVDFEINRSLNVPVYNSLKSAGSKVECVTMSSVGSRVNADGTPKDKNYARVLMLVITDSDEVADVFVYFID